jgi:hypothetical protein
MTGSNGISNSEGEVGFALIVAWKLESLTEGTLDQKYYRLVQEANYRSIQLRH